MSKRVSASVGCRQCNHESRIELYRSIWVEEPANRALILGDAINVFTCPKCRLRERLQFPFLATNVKRRFALWYEPYHDEQIDVDAAAYRKQFGPTNFLAKAPRIADWEEFKRVLLKMEAAGTATSPKHLGIPPDVLRSMGVQTARTKTEQPAPSRAGILERFWGRFRTPREVTDTVNALEVLRSAFVGSDPFVASAIERSFAWARAEAVDKRDLTVHSISTDKWKAHDLALLLLSKVSSRALSTGRYHIYRGVLSAEGNGYLRVFQQSVKALAQSGFITPHQAQDDIAAVMKELKEAG